MTATPATDEKVEGEREWPLEREIERVRSLREDILLLRFYLDRRTDISKVIDETDRLISETALKSSLEILEAAQKKQPPPAGHVASTASALMHAVGILINAARLVAKADPGTEESFPVTPQTLRASLPEGDIEVALGIKPSGKDRKTASWAATYLRRKAFETFFFFSVAVSVHFSFTVGPAVEIGLLPKSVMVSVSGFLWALVGSLVWILLRFRTFGAAYAFDPAHAKVFDARVFSGSVLSAVLLLLVFGGTGDLAESWTTNLPLWGFVIGYAGRLQVEILRVLVTRVEASIKTIFPPVHSPSDSVGTKTEGKDATPDERPKPPNLGILKKPENKKEE
ncbi:hypothetical protein ACFL7E_07955 [Thermodesulfobacteriota bacterium]